MYREFCIIYNLVEQMHNMLTMYHKVFYDTDIIVNIFCNCWSK